MSNFSYAEFERSKSCKCRRQLFDSPYCCVWILHERSDPGVEMVGGRTPRGAYFGEAEITGGRICNVFTRFNGHIQ